MKNQTKQNKIIAIMSAVILLLVALSATFTFAYFTSNVTNSEKSASFGTLRLTDSNLTISNSTNRTSSSVSATTENIIPGDTLTLSGGLLKVTGTVPAFVRFQLSVTVYQTSASDGTAYVESDKYVPESGTQGVEGYVPATGIEGVGQFTVNNNTIYAIKTEAKATGPDSNPTKAENIFGIVKGFMDETLASGNGFVEYAATSGSDTSNWIYVNKAVKGETTIFNLGEKTITLTASDYGNDWQGAIIVISYKAQAIQAEHLGLGSGDHTINANTTFVAYDASSAPEIDYLAKCTLWGDVDGKTTN